MKPRKRTLKRNSPSTDKLSLSIPWSIDTAIKVARDQKLQELEDFAVKLKANIPREQFSEDRQEELGRVIVRLAQEFKDLCTLQFDNAPLSLERAVHIAHLYRAMDWNEEAQKILRSTGRRTNRGCPPTLRRAGLRALELRVNEPGPLNSWSALARRLCICDAAEHGFRCRENLRREVQLLKVTLSKLGVEVPPPAK